MASSSSTPSPSRFPPIFTGGPVYTARDRYGFLPYLRQIRRTALILHYTGKARELDIWKWPVCDGVRVPPDELSNHRTTNVFKGPGCLCASQDPDPSAFSEAAIFEVSSGPLSGEWVAACAQHKCKYFQFLERKFNKRGLRVGAYPLRGPDSAVPAPVTRANTEPPDEDDSPSSSRTLKRTYAMSDVTATDQAPSSSPSQRSNKRRRVDIDLDDIDTNLPSPSRLAPTVTALLMKLDASIGAGISEDQFKRLFTRCICGLYMTTRSFEVHHCLPSSQNSTVVGNGAIIDLTGDD